MTKYDDSSIKVLSDIEHIRTRPAMYINTDTPSLQMFEEIFSNSMDEVMNGYASQIDVIIDYEEDKVTIIDNGRGIPQGMNETLKVPTIQVIYGKLNAGGKYNTDSYGVSGGLHGVGSCVVNALSEMLFVESWRPEGRVKVRYHKGNLLDYESFDFSEDPISGTGTQVTFEIDKDHEIFSDDRLINHKEAIERRLALSVTLFENLKIVYNGNEVERGKIDQFIPKDTYVLSEPIILRCKDTDVCINWTDSLRWGTYTSYCNMISTVSGGDHVRAVEEAVVSALTSRESLLGLNMFISCMYPGVAYTSQSKDKAKSKDMYQYIYTYVYSQLKDYLKKNPAIRDTLQKMIASKIERLDRKNNRKNISRKDRKSSFLSSLDSGGFADCTTSDRSKAELTLCEGLSAAGSLKQARDPKTQAVMPLRGKFINAYNSELKAILQNKEAATIIQSLGTGILDETDISKSRYSKVIIFSDSDEDGKDIACQLIAFFAKIMPKILTSGMLYLAIPPLYGTTVKGQFIPIHTEEDKENHLKMGHYVQRYKGLGEMNPSQLKVTSLDTETRRLIKINVNETSLSVVEKIMGGDSRNRKSLLIEMGVFKEWLRA